MSKTVIIIGGGVAGMSAAHELAERGFKVKVYEKQSLYAGGKARSVDVPDSASGSNRALPGEHGFRFFPGFYRHITDTMKRIPVKGNKEGAFSNLVPTQRVMMARFDKVPLETIVSFPRTLEDLKVALQAVFHSDTGLTVSDADFFAEKLWQLMTSCYERRGGELERIGWWQFLDADHRSEPFRQYFVGGITRTLVAAQPKEVSTKTGGDILLQLLFLMGNPKAYPDRVLNGPTNDAWLDHWKAYLQSLGVEYYHDHTAVRINTDDKVITSVDFRNGDKEQTVNVTGDYFISAVPVEVMCKLLNDGLLKLDPSLAFIGELFDDTAWMTGIQFFLNEDVQITKGHVMYTDSPWALTSISQLQFWKGFDISKFGDGKTKGVLSVDISDWDNPGLLNKIRAKDCSREDIMKDVWAQLKRSLVTQDGKCLLRDDMLVTWYLDRDIVFPGNNSTNEEPLLVNKVNTWSRRPEAYTDIPNFFLASDYVRTYTDLATMEGANEAARRAVNAIIERSGVRAKYCTIWHLHEPDLLAVYRWHDKQRFKKGLPWSKEVPWIIRAIHAVLHIFNKTFKHDPIPTRN
ncbi:FAD-dependent oxidoreductase [Fulvivirgaceae bacterium PWU4]|uniref:FAD-dependent oxidoreductase n=1 Tax=Chryseosolibacter histidini TaxID=2782349 RepID=A0AAP2DRY0_9BACT|nr:FAD-dependent oxidoreductase [Chryseosolibacter histidini]MBT1701373.1 FAD-dependent oxidoreductase [Chryseosolibacter histidini]